MRYSALWQEYDHGPTPLVLINFSADSNREALLKIFKKKIIEEGWGWNSLEEFLAEEGMSQEDLTLDFLARYFDEIDASGDPYGSPKASGEPYLVNLSNLDTGEIVYDCGLDEDDDWGEDGDEEYDS